MSISGNLNSALEEIAQIVNSTRYLDEIQDQFGRIACALVDADRVTIGIADSRTQSLSNLLVYGESFPEFDSGVHQMPDDFNLAPWLFSNEPYIVDQVVLEENALTAITDSLAKQAGFLSTLIAPITWQQNTIAAVMFRSKKERAFDKTDIRIAESIANHIAGAVANHLSHVDLRNELTERELLAEISRTITSSPDFDDVFAEVGELITDLIPSDRLSITLITEPGEPPTSVFALGAPLKGTDPKELPAVRGDISKLLNIRRRPFIVDESDPESAHDVAVTSSFAKQAGLNSWMVAPLEWQNQLIGVVHFRSKNDGAYSLEDLDLAGRIANQITGVVAGMVALEKQTVLAREREILADIGKITSSALSLKDVFGRFAELVGELIPADRTSAFIHSHDEDQPIPALVHGRELETGKDQKSTLVTGDMSELLRKVQSPMVLDGDVEDAPTDVILLDKLAKAAGLHSWLVAPLMWRGDLVGNIHFRSEKTNAYGVREVRLSQEIADQISGTVASFIAFERLESEALVRNTLVEIARMVSEADVFEAVLPQVHEVMKSVIAFDGLSFSAYDAAADEITLIYQDGFVDSNTAIGDSYPSTESYFGQVVRTGNQIRKVFESVEELCEFPRTKNAFESGARSFASAPLIAQDKIIGHVQIRSDSSDAFKDSDLTYVGRVAEQLSGAFATSLSAAQVLLQTAALEAAENAIVISDSELVVEWVNPAFVNLTGWTPEEVIGHPTKIFWSSGPERDAQGLEIRDALANKTSWSGRQLNRKKDGTEYTESVVVTPVLDSDAKLIHVIAIKQDISDQIEAESIRARKAQIDAHNQGLQKLADSRSEFLSSVSHELRTPLTIVSSFADILFNVRSENLSDEQVKYVSLIRKSSAQLAAMINDLIDVSQADSGRLFMRKEPFNLSEFIDELTDSLKVVLAANNQTLEVDNVDQSFLLDADRPRITQILTNLVTNASKYSPAGSTIALGVAVEADQAILTVKDHGYGISESDLALVFSPFFRGSNELSDGEIGVGLGLSLVKGLVLQHDGDISIDSESGIGTTATVNLPGVSVG